MTIENLLQDKRINQKWLAKELQVSETFMSAGVTGSASRK